MADFRLKWADFRFKEAKFKHKWEYFRPERSDGGMAEWTTHKRTKRQRI